MLGPKKIVSLAILAAGLALAVPAASACEADVHLAYEEPVELEGVIETKTGHHEAQGPFKVIYLQLDKGICVDPSEDDAGTETPVDRVQIAGEALSSELPVGSRVKAAGRLFPAHTMWHVEPVLIDASSIEAKAD